MATPDGRDVFLARPNGSHTQNNSLSSAATITIPAGATKIMVQAQTQNIRFTLDGTAPTTSLGFQLKAGDPPIILVLDSDSSLKFIEEAATAVLDYQFFS